MDFTVAVAWYGAIVASASFFLALYVALRDRVKIVVTYQTGIRMVTSPYVLIEPERDYIVLSVINRGRRPITIASAGFRVVREPKANTILRDSLVHGPRELTEGKRTDYVLAEEELDPSHILYPWAVDATGKKWRGQVHWTRWRPRRRTRRNTASGGSNITSPRA